MYEMFPDLWPNKNVGIAKAMKAIPDLDSKSGITRSKHHQNKTSASTECI